MNRQSIHTKDIVINYVMDGNTGGVPLIFIHSLGTDLRIWDAVVGLLAEHPEFAGRPLVRYDLRGHGLSDCPPAPYTISDHADDLADLIDHLDYDKVILIGISVGGMIAMQYAIRHADRIHALVLCDTAPVIGTSAGWKERIDTLRRHGMHHLGETIVQRWFTADFIRRQPETCSIYYNMLTRTPVDGYIGTCEAIRDADLSEAVRHIVIETLVLCGAEDLSTPPDACRLLSNAMLSARFELIEGAAHLPCIERPGEFAERLGGFLQNL